MRALVLASGGVDSSTCLGLAVDRYGKENVTALAVSYGQKHTKELECAVRVCDYYGVTADYLLCRSDEPEGAARITDMGREFLARLRDMADKAEAALNEQDRQNLIGEVSK